MRGKVAKSLRKFAIQLWESDPKKSGKQLQQVNNAGFQQMKRPGTIFNHPHSCRSIYQRLKRTASYG